MAEHLLNDRYLAALRERVRWHTESDEVLVEVEDHLRTAAERLEAAGAEPRLAERLALDRFGDPDLGAFLWTSIVSLHLLFRSDARRPENVDRSSGRLSFVPEGSP